jgi:hypothetical protein
MKSLVKKLSDWLFSITEPGQALKLQHGKLLSLLVDIRGQYRKFLLLSPSVQLRMDDLVDELRGSLSISAKKNLEDMVGRYFSDYHILPPGDYKRSVEQNDILRSTNERLHLSNEDLRLSNERLLKEVEDLQSKVRGENRPEGV